MKESIIFQPEKYSPSAKTMHSAGTLAEWHDNVLSMSKGQPWILFALCFGFVGVLLKFARMDSFGVHIYKFTSQGKTTLAQICASLWGCGSDPSVDKNSYLCRWNNTANALSAVCASHNDCLLGLDEFGTCPQKDAERFVYDIFGGKEKGRLTDKANLREQRTWRVAIFSTGEISVEAKIAQSGTARGGHFVRLLDIPGGELIVGDDPATLAKDLKKKCSKYYGTAGPAFVQAFINFCNGETTGAENYIAALLSRAEPRYQHMLPAGAAAAYSRVMDRFALIDVAGLLAHDLLGWTDVSREEITIAVETACRAWLAGNDMLMDSTRGVDAVCNFILKHRESRFLKPGDERQQILNVAGFIVNIGGQDCYAFEKAGLKEACGDIDPKIVIYELACRNLLCTNEHGKRTYKHTLPEGRRRLYTVKGTILTDDEDEQAVPVSPDDKINGDS